VGEREPGRKSPEKKLNFMKIEFFKFKKKLNFIILIYYYNNILMSKAYKKPTKLKIDLHNLIRQGKYSCVKQAVANKQDLNLLEDISKYEEEEIDESNNGFTKKKPYTPLTLAILYRKTRIARQLIKLKVNLNLKSEDNTQYTPNCLTPLAACILRKNYKLMKELLEEGANPNEYSWMYSRTFDYDNHIEYCPLMIAVERRDTKAIRILLEGGAKKRWSSYDRIGVYDIAVHPDNYTDKIFKKILRFKKK
jgi:ankyrin repeat protein